MLDLSTNSSEADPRLLVGVGFGPAAMAVATAMDDWAHELGTPVANQVVFLEKAASTQWHPDLLLPGAVINHHFLKDLATPRNPRSRFTFPCFLHNRKRLFEFCQIEGPVSRVEWSDYLAWVADLLADYVLYNQQVRSIIPLPGAGGRVERLRVATADRTFETRNVVLASGLPPWIPAVFAGLERVHHTSRFSRVLRELGDGPSEVLVVGSGQSAAEVLLHLRAAAPRARIYSSHRAVGFKLKDTGHTSNTIYFPQETEYFHALPSAARQHALKDMESADYGNVSHSVSAALYNAMYEDSVLGKPRILMLNRRRVESAEAADGRLRVTLADIYTAEPLVLNVDSVVLATGYEQDPFPPLLDEIRPYVLELDDGGPQVTRGYRLETVDAFEPSVFLSGLSERTHGISDTQSFSMMALKGDLIWSQVASQVDEWRHQPAEVGHVRND